MLLARTGVVHLRSPRAWPQYNGACEAGIGVLRALTDTAAATRGEPEVWRLEDLDEAGARANDMLRRWGPNAAPARDLWRKKRHVTLRARRQFRIVLERQLALLKKDDPHAHRLRRKAVQQALIELGYLHIHSGWVRARSTGPRSGPTYR